MRLLASALERIPAEELRARARRRFGDALRRAGSFAQIGLLGAQACLDAADGGAARLGVLWTSAGGPRLATREALAQLRRGEPAMPFTFVATQPHLAAALLADDRTITRSAFLYAPEDCWPWLLRLARGWLSDCDQVLVGRVEEAAVHESDWCLLAPARPPGASPPPGAALESVAEEKPWPRR
jgi:hypothetical protein